MEFEIRNFAKRVIQLEVQCSQLQMEKINLKEEVMEVKVMEEKMKKKYMKVKDKYMTAKEKFDLEERKWREEEEEITEKCRLLMVEKRKLENDLKAAERGIGDCSEDAAKNLKAAEAVAEIDSLKSLLEEKDGTITTLLAKNDNLERHSNKPLEMDFEARMAMEAKKQKVEVEKMLAFAQKVQDLEREKGQLEAEICKALELEKKRREMEKKKIDELVKRIGVLEKAKVAEKRAIEDERKKQVTEREKREVESKSCPVNKETTVEAESKKRVLELIQRNEVLEREKRELEAEVCRAKRQKSEEIERVLNEKTALKEKYMKETLHLVSRSGDLEREKQRLEAETKEKDERIRVLVQGKEDLVAKKKIRLNIAKPKEEVHPASNAGISGTRTTHNQGSPSVDASANEPKANSNKGLQSRRHDKRVLRSDIRRRKVEDVGCSLANKAGTKRCKSDGLEECELVWNCPEKLLSAFTASDELCMRAICALYRKQKSLGQWKYCVLLPIINKGFMQDFEKRGMALGELLTSGDSEGRLKRSLAELEQEDVEECRVIANRHYMELFQIYKDGVDSL